MNRYIIEYFSKTRASLSNMKEQQTTSPKQWIINFPNLKDCKLTIAILDNLEKYDDLYLHTGLKILTDITTDSEEKAKEISKEWVEAILNLISFSSLIYCDKAIVVSIINIVKEEHPYRYYVYPFNEKEVLGYLTKIDHSKFDEIFNAFDKSNEKPRILRSLSWLRKGIGEENSVDEFISYWTSLEVIKSILRRNLKTKLKRVSDWGGVEDIFITKLSFHNFGSIIKARRRLFHGGREGDTLDNDFMEEIKGFLEPMRKALVYCIGSILNVENDAISVIANKIPKRNELYLYSIYKGDLINLPIDFNELVKDYPRFDVNVIEKKYSINEEGGLRTDFKTQHRFSSGIGIRLEKLEIEFWGNKESGIKQITPGEMIIDKAKK